MRTSSARAFFFPFFLPRVERIAVIAQPVGYRCPRHNGEEVEEPSLGRFHPPRMAKKRKKVCPALLLRRPLHAKRGPSTPLPSPQQKKEKKTPKKKKKKRKRKIGDGSDSNGLLRWPTDRHTGGGGVLFRNVHVLGPSSVLFFFLPDFTIIFIERLECSEYHTNSERSLSFRSSDGTEIGFATNPILISTFSLIR